MEFCQKVRDCSFYLFLIFNYFEIGMYSLLFGGPRGYIGIFGSVGVF